MCIRDSYFIVDNVAEDHRFYGYQLMGDGYVVMNTNEQGQVWMEPVQMWLDWHEDDGDLVRCRYKDGTHVLDSDEFQRLYDETNERLRHAEMFAEQEAQRAEKEAQRAEEERLRADKFATYLRSIGIDPESIV